MIPIYKYFTRCISNKFFSNVLQEAKAMIHYTKPHEVGPPAKRRKPGEA